MSSPCVGVHIKYFRHRIAFYGRQTLRHFSLVMNLTQSSLKTERADYSTKGNVSTRHETTSNWNRADPIFLWVILCPITYKVYYGIIMIIESEYINTLHTHTRTYTYIHTII